MAGNEKRLIDANAIKYRKKDEYCGNGNSRPVRYVFDNDIAELPTVDAVEVVRCKDCKHRGSETYCPMCFEEWYEIDEGDGYYDSDITTHDRTIDEGFCDRGERKDNG